MNALSSRKPAQGLDVTIFHCARQEIRIAVRFQIYEGKSTDSHSGFAHTFARHSQGRERHRRAATRLSHAEDAAKWQAMLTRVTAAYRKRFMQPDGTPIQVRIGLHKGDVLSGVVGTKKPQFSLFGDTVRAAENAALSPLLSRLAHSMSHTLLPPYPRR